jgi:hypothetical protein
MKIDKNGNQVDLNTDVGTDDKDSQTEDKPTYEELQALLAKAEEVRDNYKTRSEKAEKATPKNSDLFKDEEDVDETDPVALYAKEFGGDPEAIKKLIELGKSSVSVDEKGRMDSLEARLKQRDIDDKFESLWKNTTDKTPGISDKINKNLIKKLVLDPENGDKTIDQVIEDAYGEIIVDSESTQNSQAKGKSTSPTDLKTALASDDSDAYAKYLKTDEGMAELIASL